MSGNTKSKTSKTKKTTGKKTTGKKTTKAKQPEKRFGDSIYDEILIIVLLLVSILVLISLFTGVMGIFGQAVNGLLKGLLGAGSFMLPLVVIAFCIWMIVSEERNLVVCKVLGIVLFVLSISILFHLLTTGGKVDGEGFTNVAANLYKNGGSGNGGVIGGVMAWGLTRIIGWGSYIVALVLIIISVMLGTGKSLFLFIGDMVDYFSDRRMAKDAKIKAQAESIKEMEAVRAKRAEEDELKRAAKLERKAERGGRRSFKNIILGGDEGHTADGLNIQNEEYLAEFDKDNIETMEYEVPDRPPIDLSDINFDEEAPLIEIIGVADDIEENIPVFGINEGEQKEAVAEEADIEPAIEVAYAPEQERAAEELAVPEPQAEFQEAEPLRPQNPIPAQSTTQNTKGEAEPMSIPIQPVKEAYVFPPIDLLGKKEGGKSSETKTDMLANAKKLEDTLKSFGVIAKVTQINKGPTVTRYELSPNQGVKVSKIVNLADDIALNLAATGIRIEAPIPGKAAVGIEVPNRETQSVYLRSVLESEAFKDFPSKLAFALGEDIAGKAIVTDIAKMPHLLIAGATGSGKSVCINTLITSILYKANPDEVKLLLVDPKVVELSVYNGVPHLLIPVVTDPKKAAGALNWAVREMLGRYQSFAEHNVRDIKGYNAMKEENGEEDRMPQIVIVIDELADLMMAAPGEVEDAICRLAQMARAAGIHLIIATQRPSVDVITGVIKANIPSRLAFAVSSGIDSRTILDSVGAEKLLGKGDMLFYPVGMSKPVRIQGAFVTDKEVESIVDFVKGGRNVSYDQQMIDQITTVAKSADAGEDSDEFYDQAVDLVVEKEKASVSMLQRQFRIGYNRAARIVEDLEKRGVVGPEEGSKPRKVLMTKAQLNELLYPTNDEID